MNSSAKTALGITLLGLAGFVFVEGLVSTLHVLRLLVTQSSTVLAARSHTRYDPDLGWVNRADLSMSDLYGRGASLHTNAQGFRARHDFQDAVPAGRIRVICSGDSFALGYGVDDSETWCQQLEGIDPRIEAVNMGQGGYGVGQSFLWYRRDGVPLEHDIHLFTFIGEDFARLGRTDFAGYGKPLLVIRDDQLVSENVPVPRAAYRAPWLAQNASLLYELRSLRALRRLLRRDSAPGSAGPAPQIPEVAVRIFEELDRLHRRSGRQYLLIYLPVLDEYEGERSNELRQFLAKEARSRSLPYVDLVDTFRQLPAERATSMFIPAGAIDFPGAEGHYDAVGNRVVAKWVYEQLVSLIPKVRR